MSGPRARLVERRVPERIAAVAVFVAVYFLLWRPLRIWLAQDVMVALLNAFSPVVGLPYSFSPVGGSPIIAAMPLTETGATASLVYQWRMPGGMFFFLGATLLIAYAPRRLYWIGFLGFLLALGGASLAALLFGLGGWAAGFEVQAFIEVYLIRPLSLGIPLLAVLRPFEQAPLPPSVPDTTTWADP